MNIINISIIYLERENIETNKRMNLGTNLSDAFNLASDIAKPSKREYVNQESEGTHKSTFIRPQVRQQSQQSQQQQQQPKQQQQSQQQQQNQQDIQSQSDYISAQQNIAKKKNLLKLLSYSLMVLLAITIYTSLDFLLKDFVASNDISTRQELGIRLVCPVLIVFILWNMKMFV